jgi:hypothetical protein
MKILIISKPRSKSTALGMYLKKIYPKLSYVELRSFLYKGEKRKKNTGTSIIYNSNELKKKDNILVKFECHYLINYVKKEILEFNFFNLDDYDLIFFCDREDSLDALLSNIAREDLYQKKNKEHYSEKDSVPQIEVKVSDIIRKLREDLVFDCIKKYVKEKYKNVKELEYEKFEKQFKKIFKVSCNNFDIPIKPSGINYRKYTSNIEQTEKWFANLKKVFKKLNIDDIKNKRSIFWKNTLS